MAPKKTKPDDELNACKRVRDHLGFVMRSDKIQNRILIPKYYNPEITQDLQRLKNTHTLVTVDELVKEKKVSVDTGVEIGKMAYGTGTIPFIRTSDFSNWEIKADFKHGVSQDVYDEYRGKIDVEPGDILMARRGTHLIGTTAIVTKSDVPMLFQSQIYRIRTLAKKEIDPWILFACLNAPIVKRQIRAKQFTQDIIDTLGKRLFEVVLPIPKNAKMCKKIADEMRQVIEKLARLNRRTREIPFEVEGIIADNKNDVEVMAGV